MVCVLLYGSKTVRFSFAVITREKVVDLVQDYDMDNGVVVYKVPVKGIVVI